MAAREGTIGDKAQDKPFCEKVGSQAKKLVFKNNTGMSRWIEMESGATASTIIIPAGESYLCMCSPWVAVMHAEASRPLTVRTYDDNHSQFNLTTTKTIGADKETYLMTNTNGNIPSEAKPKAKLNYTMEWWSNETGSHGENSKGYAGSNSYKIKQNTCRTWNH